MLTQKHITEAQQAMADGEPTNHVDMIAPPADATPRETATEREPWRDQYERDVLAGADANHIWVDAFACVNPSAAVLQAIGAEVMRMLTNPECAHVSALGHMLNSPAQQEVVIRVNKS